MTSKKLTRLNFIDVARSYAIIPALFSHAMLAFGGFAALGEDALKIKLFTRTATPLYAVGLIACAITLFILSRIIPLHGKMPGWTRVPLAFSRSSLLSYSLGNIFLSLLPAAAASQMCIQSCSFFGIIFDCSDAAHEFPVY